VKPVILIALIVAGAANARAQELPSQLMPATRDSLERLMDSARVARLPAVMLAAKAAEGVLKGADDQRILHVVRQLYRELGAAAKVLPSSVAPATLSAAATALHAGVTASTLKKLAATKASEEDLAVALVTLSDLMASRVPSDLAASSVEELVRRRASDAEMAAFRASVSRDIANGADPSAALNTGMRDAVRSLDGQLPTIGKRPPA
jgi:hypothetical protein